MVAVAVAAPALGQADLRWFGSVHVSETSSWKTYTGQSAGFFPSQGSGSFTIPFNGEAAIEYTPAYNPEDGEYYSFHDHPAGPPSASVSAGTGHWQGTDASGNTYTCSTTGTLGAVTSYAGVLRAGIYLSHAGTLQFQAGFGADSPYLSYPVSWETSGAHSACDEPVEDEGGYVAGIPLAFLSYPEVAYTRSESGVVTAAGTVPGRTDPYLGWIVGGGEAHDVSITVDLKGYPPEVKPEEEEEEPQPRTEVKDPVVLRLDASRFPPGNGTLKAAGVTCHGGNQNCSVTVERGSTVRVVADAQTGSMTHGLYGCDQSLGLACTVHMSGDRTVTAYFGEDPEILDPTLLTPDQKIDLAQRAADAATEGAVGCVAGAIVIGTGGTAAAAEVALLGSTTAGKIFTDCAQGAVLTGALGMLLKVDPPDPDFRSVGYPEALPTPKERPCRLRRGCKPLTRAARRVASAARRVASLTEAAAVAGNRYGNAINARDARVQHVQRAAFTVLLDLAADVDARRAAHSRKLAALLRRRGVRRLRVNVPKRVKISTAALDRLVRKRLATSRDDARRLVLGVKARRKPVDVLKALRAPARTAGARAALANLRAADLPLLVLAIADQERVRTAGLDGALQALASCDEGSAATVRTALASLSAEPVLIAGRAVDELARRAALPGCIG